MPECRAPRRVIARAMISSVAPAFLSASTIAESKKWGVSLALPPYPHWVLQAGAISRSAPSSGRVERPDKFRRPLSQRSDPNKRWDASAVAFAEKVFPRAFSVSTVSARPVHCAALKQMGASAEYGIGFTVRRPLAILPSMNCAWNFARSRCCSLTVRRSIPQLYQQLAARS